MSYNTKPFFIACIENTSWLVLILSIFVTFFNLTFGISLTNIIKNLFNWNGFPDIPEYDPNNSYYLNDVDYTIYDGSQKYGVNTYDGEQRIRTPPDDSLHAKRVESMQNLNENYIKNPFILFGVNGFGKKNSEEEALVKKQQKQNMNYPRTQQEMVLENKVTKWKNQPEEKLKINSYNEGDWYKYE